MGNKMIKLLKNFLLIFVLIMFSSNLYAARVINTNAKQALLIDFETNRILLNKNADVPMAPASMSKLMTIYLAFEALEQKRISLDTELIVSEKAWLKKDSKGKSLPPSGSRMFLEPDTRVKFEDLLRGIIIQSGNDACIVVAEGLSGTEEQFVEEMNKKAEKIGLTNSNFQNSTGWPHPDHYMSSIDLAKLSKILYIEFPEYMYYFAEKKFEYNGIPQPNRNPVLHSDLGVDGLKTGYTKNSGYGVVISAIKDGKRLILVLNGIDTIKNRKAEAERILSWGFREFKNIQLFNSNDAVATVPVWLGNTPNTDLIVKENITLTVAKGADGEDLKATYKYSSPLKAPIFANQIVGKVLIKDKNGNKIKEYNLYPLENIEKAGPISRLFSSLSYIIWGESSVR